jgi:hypothetical protein
MSKEISHGYIFDSFKDLVEKLEIYSWQLQINLIMKNRKADITFDQNGLEFLDRQKIPFGEGQVQDPIPTLPGLGSKIPPERNIVLSLYSAL